MGTEELLIGVEEKTWLRENCPISQHCRDLQNKNSLTPILFPAFLFSKALQNKIRLLQIQPPDSVEVCGFVIAVPKVSANLVLEYNQCEYTVQVCFLYSVDKKKS